MPFVITHDELTALLPLLEHQPALTGLLSRLKKEGEKKSSAAPANKGDQVSAHFRRQEFACHCGCGGAKVNIKLLDVLETLRAASGGPLVIVSGYRCTAHNRAVGGARASQHCLGNAADIRSATHTPAEIAAMAERILGAAGGVGRYQSFTHVDVRPGGPARWTG